MALTVTDGAKNIKFNKKNDFYLRNHKNNKVYYYYYVFFSTQQFSIEKTSKAFPPTLIKYW
jgi:hypothetical protein